MEEAIRIAEYDPRWPELFEEESARIAAALGDRIEGIEHVGSTAVPGLGAKPIIDIMIGLRQLADGEECIPPLEALGYECRGEAGVPGRLFFCRFTDGVRTHHLHMAQKGSELWERPLLFRNYLREHPEEADEYYRLKKRLAVRMGANREAYTAAKTQFIESVLAKAEAGAT